MCGFAGIFDLSGGVGVSEPLLEKMCDAIAHRGADGFATTITEKYGVGFRRLAIMDLEQGMQPFTLDNERVILVCNGEIFNSPQLRAELSHKNISYTSNTDTEVLIHLYEEYGIDFVNKIDGQFAISLFDSRTQELHLMRDQFGICPLHYYESNGAVLFGSEIKALLEHPLVDRKLNIKGIDTLLTLPGLVSPITAFKGVASVKPGTRMSFSVHGSVENVYWDLEYPDNGEINTTSEKECVDTIESLLRDSITKRMQSDIPLGVYLSGGLDSSLISAIMKDVQLQDVSKKSISAFSIGFQQNHHDESEPQRMMAQHLSMEHYLKQVSDNDIIDGIKQSLYFSECPVKESYNVCSMLLSQLAKDQGVQVILSGEGADELFGGYLGYRFDAMHDRRAELDSLEAALEEEAAEIMWGDFGCFYEKDYASFRDIKQSLYASHLQGAFNDFDISQQSIVSPQAIQGKAALHQRSYLDFKLRLVDHLVSDHGDRMGMANTVEVRYPFLDKRLVEFSTKIPPGLLVYNGTEKYLLKEVAQKYLPNEIVARQKFGFRAPNSSELLKNGVEWIHDYLSPECTKRMGLFNSDTIEHIKKRYVASDFRLNVPYEDDLLMSVATTHLFIETFNLTL
ncbi:MAG: asparagine synthase (glutamine-hydrolyzing) [Reichenbachiella sp.]